MSACLNLKEEADMWYENKRGREVGVKPLRPIEFFKKQ